MTPDEIRSMLGRALVEGKHRVPFIALSVTDAPRDNVYAGAAYVDGIRWHRVDCVWVPYTAISTNIDAVTYWLRPAWQSISVMNIDASTGPVSVGCGVIRVELDAIRCCRPGEAIDGVAVCALDRDQAEGEIEVAWFSTAARRFAQLAPFPKGA